MSWSHSKKGKRSVAAAEFGEAMTGSMNQGALHDGVVGDLIAAASSIAGQAAEDATMEIASFGHIGADGKGNASLTVTIS